MRPYLSSGTSFVYLGALLVYSYLVNLSTKESKDKRVKIKDTMRDVISEELVMSRPCGTSLVYLADHLVYSYLVNLFTKRF